MLENNINDSGKNTGKTKLHLGTALRTVVLMLIVAGVAYPLLLLVIGQQILPYQSNGSMKTLDDGSVVGSTLIAQDFQSPKFFHPRPSTDSASGVDPHITPENALAQVENVSHASGISEKQLRTLIQLDIERNRVNNLAAFAPTYVNVLELNLQLATQYPDVYSEFLQARQG